MKSIWTALELKLGLRGKGLATNHSKRDAAMMILITKMAAI